jgi:plasmid maintenance system killer protein
METTFKSKKLKRICNSERELQKAYGVICAGKIRRRLDDLQASRNLEDMRSLPGRCHELVGNKKGQLSLDVEQPYRLIFEPTNEDIKYKDVGGLDWLSVTAVKIIGLENTHG